MVIRLRASKIKAAMALILVLCLIMPIISSIASTYERATHTHICYDEKHENDCDGTVECCNVCYYFYDIKNQILRCNFASKLSMPALALSLLPANSEFQYIPYISLISLKVRLNN